MIAWLLPLASFVLILFFGKRMGPAGKLAGYVATGAIASSCLLSMFALFGVWLPSHPLSAPSHHGEHQTDEGTHEEEGSHDTESGHAAASNVGMGVAQHLEISGIPVQQVAFLNANTESTRSSGHADSGETHAADGSGGAGSSSSESSSLDHANNGSPIYYAGSWYDLGVFGKLKLSIGYYIDTLTVVMFCMVTLIASCVHLYATGYMHDELHDFTDPEVTLVDGSQLRRKGRYYRFFQYLSLFSFSMLGVVIAGNMAMVFVFWELVGICSYFLIGFYIERKSASTAANKAFIVNRVGDFGMLIGLMALWSSLGTFNFGDQQDAVGHLEPGIFSLLRTPENNFHLKPTEGMTAEAVRDQVSPLVLEQIAASEQFDGEGGEAEKFDGEVAVAKAVAQLQGK
ncbi:MAG: proton-conducting transporter membrane subunit, partial [Pirellulales bacterium]